MDEGYPPYETDCIQFQTQVRFVTGTTATPPNATSGYQDILFNINLVRNSQFEISQAMMVNVTVSCSNYFVDGLFDIFSDNLYSIPIHDGSFRRRVCFRRYHSKVPHHGAVHNSNSSDFNKADYDKYLSIFVNGLVVQSNGTSYDIPTDSQSISDPSSSAYILNASSFSHFVVGVICIHVAILTLLAS
ncbi:hypothetical protein DFA_00065 [Cavenderia fasciculata]|uniref:Uncharacterized protein n=1 Tax=Cavenderia fasciculata TaxID=261658 RepID=F4PXH8_CACFS|nr:uncharacterized protein DFA_00065 [Cavenderia fasciculata]EGG19488.1 hypothetical protein DFA_00065 [Cavenderia fasciculata]|eukprot:XP_004357782.1 hypothetical protein DFA_00065 [Cavenderia fasciculata]